MSRSKPGVADPPASYVLSAAGSCARASASARLAQHGPQALSTDELLSRLVGYTPGDALEASLQRFMQRNGLDLAGLARTSVPDLAKVPGMGQGRAQRVLAGLELGRRVVRGVTDSRPFIDSPEAAAGVLCPVLEDPRKETVKVLLLDTRNRLIRIVTISVGSLDSSIIHPREVYFEAVTSSAAAVIVGHNHPSGDPTPSPQDREVTVRLEEAGKILGIELVDHIVVGDGRWVSLRQAGWK